MEFDYSDLFPTEVYSFLHNKAKSIGSSIGYLLPSILTRILGYSWKPWCMRMLWLEHIYSPSIYTQSSLAIQEREANSPAIEKIVNPVHDNGCIGKEILFIRSTSSGLVKLHAKRGTGPLSAPQKFTNFNQASKKWWRNSFRRHSASVQDF